MFGFPSSSSSSEAPKVPPTSSQTQSPSALFSTPSIPHSSSSSPPPSSPSSTSGTTQTGFLTTPISQLLPSTDDLDNTHIYSLHIPRRLLILPPTAVLLGLCIGISRGGSRARLRFLAENAHRQPTTVQGWYFYTKTRNYRILFGALKQGAKDGMKLGAVTAGYVVVEDGFKKLRERYPWMKGTDAQAKGEERNLEWLDGGAAGGILGLLVGGYNRFATPLLLRTAVMGAILGGLEGILRITQDKVRQMRLESERESESASGKISETGEHVV